MARLHRWRRDLRAACSWLTSPPAQSSLSKTDHPGGRWVKFVERSLRSRPKDTPARCRYLPHLKCRLQLGNGPTKQRSRGSAVRGRAAGRAARWSVAGRSPAGSCPAAVAAQGGRAAVALWRCRTVASVQLVSSKGSACLPQGRCAVAASGELAIGAWFMELNNDADKNLGKLKDRLKTQVNPMSKLLQLHPKVKRDRNLRWRGRISARTHCCLFHGAQRVC